MNKNSLKNWSGTTAVIGVDWGDSGKGRLVDDLAQRAHVVARFNGGSNTGHTVQNQLGHFALHLLPSGIFNQNALCLIGRGVALDLESLIDDELVQLKNAGSSWENLVIDGGATLTMPWHKLRDNLREKFRQAQIGTTGRGVGPTYADRVERVGLLLKDLVSSNFKHRLKAEIYFQNKLYKFDLDFPQIYKKYSKYAQIIAPLVGNTVAIVKKAQKEAKNILFEGAQGWFLDLDFGTYPYVTSSNTGLVGIWRSFDIHPTEINQTIGITKAYTTRVGAGPMPTKLQGKIRNFIIQKGQEVGTTSGRIRDPGWLDLVLIRAACAANRVNHLAISKLDILSSLKALRLCVAYQNAAKTVDYKSGDADFLAKCQPVYEILPGWNEDISQIKSFKKLPPNAQKFIKKVENYTNVGVSFIGVGPDRSQAIYV